ncbi:MAG: hypothetical protein HOV83_29235 [Catenulispora sp.]|nr:hypothetical protein [Catenulispora sp.]
MPASTWKALVRHLTDPADQVRAADSARSRLLYCYAEPLYRAAADASDYSAVDRLARSPAAHGDLDDLRERAAERLAGLLAERGDIDGLRLPEDTRDP